MIENNLFKRKCFGLDVFIRGVILYCICFMPLSAVEVKVDDYIGLNYITNYSPEDYKLQPQNWCIVQDQRGIIYAANQGGLLEYDGVSWRQIEVPNTNIRSLAMDESGTIYVGGLNEFGYLEADANGTLLYRSLVQHLEDRQKNFFNVWRIHTLNEGIYFMTWKYLFRWEPGTKQIKVWETGKERYFRASFTCGGKLFLRQENTGVVQMGDDTLQLLPGSERFGIIKIYMMAPYAPYAPYASYSPDNRRDLVIVTRDSGFFRYKIESHTLEAIPGTGAAGYLQEKEFYYGQRLSNGDFALATGSGGLVIMDANAAIKKVFTKASGLQNESVKYVCEDLEGNLWLALEKGISKIEYASSISIYDDNRSNLPGLVLAVTQHGQGNKLYVGTTRGLFFLETISAAKFQQVPGISESCFSLASLDHLVLAATQAGVYGVEEDKTSLQVTRTPAYVLLPSGKNPNRVWVGTVSGLYSLIAGENRQWREERQFIKEEPVRTIVEEPGGTLWLGSEINGAVKIDFPQPGDMSNSVITRYDTSHGLPGGVVRVFKAAGRVMFATNNGLFRFNQESGTFTPDNTLGAQFNTRYTEVFRIAEDRMQNLWLHSENRNIQAIHREDGTYTLNEKPFLRIPPVGVNAIYPTPDGKAVWFAGNEGLIRYDTTMEKTQRHEFSTLIRKVVVNGQLVFDGYQAATAGQRLYPVLPYRNRNLRFEFAAPFFEAEPETRYQYVLEGYDQDWSPWSKEPQIAYTNLDGGVYSFRVRAKNVYENISREAVFNFRVLPPWYKTWWAFLLYAAAVFPLIFLIVKWRSWKLVQEKQRLERLVEERTAEIHDKNRQLQEQSEKLKEMDNVKSRFFANISHEFRTPLTLIMGPLEYMLHGKRDKEEIKRLNLMLRHSRRLLNLINQLLDLSKIDSGRMKLRAEQRDMLPFLKGIVNSFELVTAQHEIELTFHASTGTCALYFDPEKLEQVMTNLLINAIKFTPQGGKITVTAAETADNFMEISVRDTGRGIPKEQLEYIFDRFFQAEESIHAHHPKGTGIGLALTRELINLHHGKIDVRSQTGEKSGTEFIIRLPLGAGHLEPGEIADSSPGFAEEGPALSFKTPTVLMPEEEEPVDGEREPETGGKNGAHDKDIILVIEDNRDVREYIRGSLEPAYTVVEAKNGKEGLEKAGEIIPDLIVSDVMMPGIDGYELSRKLKKDVLTSHIPIILLTARAAEEDMLEGLGTGADDYITKPFNTRILFARIKNLIDLRRQLQENLKREMTFQPVKSTISPVDREFLGDLHAVIEKNIGDTDFNVEQLARKMYMSRATIYRKIIGLTGETPTDYIRTYRLKRGAELLKSNFGSVLEVALEVGFSSSAYFTKCFKDMFHQVPTEYTRA